MKNNSNQYKAVYIATIISILFTASGLNAQEKLPASEAFSETTKEFLSDPARTGSLLGTILAGAALANPFAPLLGSVAGFMIGKSSAFTEMDGNAARRNAFINRSLIPEKGDEVSSLTGLTGSSGLADSSEGLTAFPGITVNSELKRSTNTQAPQASVKKTIAGPSGATVIPRQPDLNEPIVIVGFPGETLSDIQSNRTQPIVMVELPEEPGTADQLEQTVSLESNGETVTGSDLQKQLAHACRNVSLSQPMPSSCYYYSQ